MVIDILKRRGGWPVTGLRVALDGGRRNSEVHDQLSLWRLWRVRPEMQQGVQQGIQQGMQPEMQLERVPAKQPSTPGSRHPLSGGTGQYVTH
jgi:hypothetical protein